MLKRISFRPIRGGPDGGRIRHMFDERYRPLKLVNEGNGIAVRVLRQQAQRLPSRDPHDPKFRRLWYVRYADDFLLGLTGSKGEAEAIKQELSDFLHHDLHMELNEEKTLVTHAHDDCARFLGYEVQVLHDDSKHDFRRRRCINGSIGLRVPTHVLYAKRTRYMR